MPFIHFNLPSHTSELRIKTLTFSTQPASHSFFVMMDPSSATDQHPKAQEAIDRAIESIMPEAQEDPELYKRVVKILRSQRFTRIPTWSESYLYKGFSSWAKVTSAHDRMKLDTFIACDAVHRGLSFNQITDNFSVIVRQRKMREWAVSEIRAATSKINTTSKAKMARIKQEKARQGLANSKPASTNPTPTQSEGILPSVEHSVSPTRRPSSLHRTILGSPEASPFVTARPAKRVLSATSETHAGGPAPKAAKLSRDASRPAARTRDAATQTETERINLWTSELAGNFVEPFKQAFAEVAAAQSKTLTETLPAAVKAAVQQLLATEAAHGQPQAVLLRPQAPRPVVPETALARQAYSAYAEAGHGSSRLFGALHYPYDDVRQVARSDVRGLAAERLLDLGPYILHLGGEQRRQ